MARRAFSLVELLFVVAVSALVLGVTVSLYSFSMLRLAKNTAHFSTEDQARKLLDEIEAVVRDSTNVQVVAGSPNPGLKCTLAQDSYRASTAPLSKDSKTSASAEPIGVTKRGYDKHGTGRRVWFYFGGETGAFPSSGKNVWRSERNDDSAPTTSDVRSDFSHYYGGATKRFPLVTSFTFSVDANNKTVTVTVTAQSLWRDERSDPTGDRASQTFTESRTMGWRHWFK